MEKKKQKLFLLIGVVCAFFVIAIVLIYFFVIRKPSTSINTAAPKSNDPAVEKLVTVSQTSVFLSDFSTEEVHETRDLVHMRIWPVVSLYTTENITSFKVKNIHVETSNDYDVAIIYPGHVPNNLSQYDILYGTREEVKVADIQDAGTTLEYKVVDTAAYYDEVSRYGGYPQWLIILKNLGEYNYTEIMNRDHIYESDKILQYAGVTGDDLQISFYFDVEIIFENGEKYTKRFSSQIDGAQYLQDGFYNGTLTY